MAHTKGPWRYDQARNSIVTDGILFDVLGDGSEMQSQDVISTFGAMSGDDVNADIALIVAAPDMLAALESAHYLLSELRAHELDDPDSVATMAAIEAAIRKARPDTPTG